MERPENIQSLYNHLEDDALKYNYSHQIADLFKKLRDKLEEDKNSSDAEKAQWETNFFNFVSRDGEVYSSYQSTDKDGNIIKYPSFDKFDDQTYDYLIERFSWTNNILLKARYAHLLWFSPKRLGNYAQTAIDSYLELTNIYEEKDKIELGEHHGLSVLSSIKNAYYIARQANDNHRIGLAKDKIRELIFHYNEKSTSLLTIRFDLIKLMLDDKKIFREKDFSGISCMCLQVAESFIKSGNGFRSISFFELGESVDEKLKTKTHEWRTSIAECYESMMRQNEKEPLISIGFCQNAIENYRRVKNTAKIDELEVKYGELKASLKLESFEYQVDQTGYAKECERLSQNIVKNNSSDYIIGYLALNKSLLPTYKDMEAQAEQQSKDHPLLDIFPTIVLDQNAHPAQIISHENAKFYKIINDYRIFLEISKLRLINQIFIDSIKEKKLSLDILLNFLNKYSWLSNDISKPLPNDRILEYNWLTLVAPALNEYFLQMDYFLYSENYPNLVLAIDSLTLKIEGILRDFCDNIGIITSKQKAKQTGFIAQEKNLDDLLREQKLSDHFDEDEILLFRFILIEKAGYYLRHRVAHSLTTYADYDISIMHLLILILLRLSKLK